MLLFEYQETRFNPITKRSEKVADWCVVPTMNNNKIIVQKITPQYKSGDSIKKVFRVEDTTEFVFKAMKTKIKARGAAEGLVKWMIKDKDLFSCRIRNLLNYAWDEMKYEYL